MGWVFDIIRRILKSRSDKKGKIYPGWFLAIASSVASFLSTGSFYYGFSAYFKPIAEEFGWSRATMSSLWSFGRVEGAAEGPFGGIATDVWGPRLVHFLGVFMSGLGFILMYFTRNFLTAFVFYIIAAVGFNLGYTGPLDKALTDWFIKKRGAAISITRVGRALGGTIMPTILTLLLIAHGWRLAFVIVGVSIWVINLPLAWLFVKQHRPEYYGLMPDGEMFEGEAENVESLIKAGEEYSRNLGEFEFTWRQAIKNRAFWIPQVASWFSSIYTAITVHIVPYLTDMGVGPVLAAAAMGFMVFMSTPGRIISGILIDRISTNKIKYLMVFSSGVWALAMIILLSLQTTVNSLIVYSSLALFGLGVGVSSTANTLMLARYFGRKHFGTITGIRSTVNVWPRFIAPIYTGWIFDITGSYIECFTILLVLDVVGVILYYFSNPPKQHINEGNLPEIRS